MKISCPTPTFYRYEPVHFSSLSLPEPPHNPWYTPTESSLFPVFPVFPHEDVHSGFLHRRRSLPVLEKPLLGMILYWNIRNHDGRFLESGLAFPRYLSVPTTVTPHLRSYPRSITSQNPHKTPGSTGNGYSAPSRQFLLHRRDIEGSGHLHGSDPPVSSRTPLPRHFWLVDLVLRKWDLLFLEWEESGSGSECHCRIPEGMTIRRYDPDHHG